MTNAAGDAAKSQQSLPGMLTSPPRAQVEKIEMNSALSGANKLKLFTGNTAMASDKSLKDLPPAVKQPKRRTGLASPGSMGRDISGMGMSGNPMVYQSDYKSIYDRIDPSVKVLDDTLRRKKKLQA